MLFRGVAISGPAGRLPRSLEERQTSRNDNDLRLQPDGCFSPSHDLSPGLSPTRGEGKNRRTIYGPVGRLPRSLEERQTSRNDNVILASKPTTLTHFILKETAQNPTIPACFLGSGCFSRRGNPRAGQEITTRFGRRPNRVVMTEMIKQNATFATTITTLRKSWEGKKKMPYDKSSI